MFRTTLRVFEHQTLHEGERVPVANGGMVIFGRKHLDALARFNDRHGGQYFKLGYRRVTFTHYVGYLEVERLGVEVLPKADRRPRSAASEAEWRGALLTMLRVALGMRLYTPGPASQALGRSSLIELVALRFVAEVERLLHEGLAKGYRSVEANQSAFRGRLLVSENLRENVARADRFFVRFPSFDANTLLNRVLRQCLRCLAELCLSPSLHARVKAADLAFPDVEPGRFTALDLDRIKLSRSTARYASALTLARMILENQAPGLRTGRAGVFALLFDMNVLWERFVTALFRRAAPIGATVHAQESRPFWRATARPARLVRPDIVVRSGGQVALIADAKWKLHENEPSMGELQQMFAYNECWNSQRSVLVYPGNAASGVSGVFHAKSHTCQALHIDALSREPERVLRDLLNGGA